MPAIGHAFMAFYISASVDFPLTETESTEPVNKRILRAVLLSNLNCSSTVESYELLTHVNKITIVDGGAELSGGNA